jgi:hypothetical protein
MYMTAPEGRKKGLRLNMNDRAFSGQITVKLLCRVHLAVTDHPIQ